MAILYGIHRREPCANCGLPVFIADRLNVGKQLFHRTCFRCARCNSKLTLANYYETENNEFCCETCPDEEIIPNLNKLVLSRSFSDEEKSSGLKNFEENDKYSTLYESAMESEYTIDKFTSARSNFIKTQIENYTSNTSNENEPPELPRSIPPNITKNSENESSSFIIPNTSSDFSSVVRTDDNSAFSTEELVNSVSDSVINQRETASTKLDETHNFVTKETKHNDGSTCTSTVKGQELLSEKNFENQEEKSELNKIEHEIQTSDMPSLNLSSVHASNVFAPEETNFKEENISSITLSSTEFSSSNTLDKTHYTISDGTSEKSHCTISDDTSEKSHYTISDDMSEKSLHRVSDNTPEKVENHSREITESNQCIPTTNSNDIKEPEKEIYPEDVNPFGNDDSEEETTSLASNLKNMKSLNPFGDDEESRDDTQKPKQAIRKKCKPMYLSSDRLEHRNCEEESVTKSNLKKSKSKSLNPFDSDDEFENEIRSNPVGVIRKEIIPLCVKEEHTGCTPEHLKSVDTQRLSESFGEEYKKPPLPTAKKIIHAPKISLNPFWSDGEEPPDEDSEDKPIPIPRTAKSAISAPEPTFGSNTSICSGTSNAGQTIRKKKPAPKPPINNETYKATNSASSSLNVSPSHSVPHSPKSMIKLRKNKRAPQPPNLAYSTPFSEDARNAKTFHDVSPIISDVVLKTKSADNKWDNEKNTKDELNRNRQSQNLSPEISPSSSESSSSVAAPNKSTYGKWKRRKGPAPSRPIPQKRSVKSVSILEMRRELDMIEIQLQGLEKQGVRLEQIIREKCEGPNVTEDIMLSADVEDMVLQLFDLVNEKNELFRRQTELMYLRRQHRLEEEYADVEYQIRCLMLLSEASKTDSDKAREDELIQRLVEIVERRNEIVECLEMDRVRKAEEDDGIKCQLNEYFLKRDESQQSTESDKKSKKEKKKHKKEKRFKLKNYKFDIDKDVDESESFSSESSMKEKEKKKKKFNIF